MRLKIVQTGEPCLREEARLLTLREITSAEVQRLILDMRDTMRDAPGVGLAAPQVGIPLQMAVIEDRQEYHQALTTEQLAARERQPLPFHVIINPTITLLSEESAEFPEGCLSVPGFTAMVARARHVRVECLNEHGEPRTITASGWYARILQHEIDHLRGMLYIDKMKTRTFATLENWSRFGK